MSEETKSIFPTLPMQQRASLVIGITSNMDGLVAIKVQGPRRAGKTTFAEILRRAFNDLGASVNVEDGSLTKYIHDVKLPFEGARVFIEVEQA